MSAATCRVELCLSAPGETVLSDCGSEKMQPAGLLRKTRAAKRPPNFSVARTLSLRHLTALACLWGDAGDREAHAIVDGCVSASFSKAAAWLEINATMLPPPAA